MRHVSYIAAALLGAAISLPPAIAQDIGVAACDSFVKVYETCIAAKAPADQKDKMRSVMDQVKTNWIAVAKTEDGKKQLDAVCKQTADQLKTQLAPLGCAW
jgi:pyruvate/2-oxoacid:ferredoxin oxidoreductase beta subunit